MNKGLAVTLITILSIFAIGLAVSLFLLIKGDFTFDNFNFSFTSSAELIEEKEIYNIKDLDINTNTADIYVEEKNIDNIKVELYSNNLKAKEIREDSDKIYIKLEEKKKIGFIFNRKSPKVVVYVPMNYTNNVLVNTKVGDVKIGNLPDSLLVVKAEVGDVKVKQIDSATITLKTGDIKIENINKLTSTTKTGDIKVGDVDEISTKTTTGDIRVNTVNKKLTLSSRTGDIRIDTANIISNSKIETNVGDIKIRKTTGCYIEANSKVGDKDIVNNDRKSDVELIINSRVGDIKVNY